MHPLVFVLVFWLTFGFVASQREATRTLGDHVKAIQTENKDMSNKIQQTQTRAQLENQGRNRK